MFNCDVTVMCSDRFYTFQSLRDLFRDSFFFHEASQQRDDTSFQVPPLFTGSWPIFSAECQLPVGQRRRCQSMTLRDWDKIRRREAAKRRLETRRISSFNFAATIQFPEPAAKERLDISLLFFGLAILFLPSVQPCDCCSQSLPSSLSGTSGQAGPKRGEMVLPRVTQLGECVANEPFCPRPLTAYFSFFLQTNSALRFPPSSLFLFPFPRSPSCGRCSSFLLTFCLRTRGPITVISSSTIFLD